MSIAEKDLSRFDGPTGKQLTAAFKRRKANNGGKTPDASQKFANRYIPVAPQWGISRNGRGHYDSHP